LIDPRAVVDPAASIADSVTIGPFSVIGPDVVIGEATWVGPHVVINGPTTIGRKNRIFQFASVGEIPQDKKYAGEPSRLEIGDRNVIREYVTINRGTVQEEGATRIGNDNWIMAYVHIAHACRVGNHTVFANNASLAGHVSIADYAILGGFTLVHQFCAIGAYAFSSFGSVISKDVPPYVMVAGNPARVRGLNSEGLKRKGFPDSVQKVLRDAYKTIYRSNHTLDEALSILGTKANDCEELAVLVSSLEKQTRGIVR
jgi:UDP-N-acetylglucosamine acyltransferase